MVRFGKRLGLALLPILLSLIVVGEASAVSKKVASVEDAGSEMVAASLSHRAKSDIQVRLLKRMLGSKGADTEQVLRKLEHINRDFQGRRD